MAKRKEFAAACRYAYPNRGAESVEQATLECAERCRKALGDDMKVDGVSVVAMPDQTALVTVLASMTREESDPQEE